MAALHRASVEGCRFAFDESPRGLALPCALSLRCAPCTKCSHLLVETTSIQLDPNSRKLLMLQPTSIPLLALPVHFGFEGVGEDLSCQKQTYGVVNKTSKSVTELFFFFRD